MATPTTSHKLGAEALGTFWLVLGGCGTAVLAGNDVHNLGIALAFGLTVLTGAYAFGHISGGHFNPAVTIGLAAAKRFSWNDVLGYIVAQVVGATVAATVLYVIASGQDGFDAHASGFASNGYGDHSPGGYSLLAALITEIVLTAFFLYVILGASAKRAAVGFSGLSIGLALTLIHLISIPIDGTSVNPARSLGVAWFAGADALGQVWLFIVAPIIGAVIAGVTHAVIVGADD
ncbi:MAG: aquaporin [Aeromicrobium sp.]|nr:aquaporin [Aeromicrobium sp.]